MEEVNDSPNLVTKLSLLRMLAYGSCTSGVNFGYSAEFVYGTPLFVTLGLSHSLTSFAWLAGPISGLIALPLSGAASDILTTRFGRRKPFIVVGVILTIIGMVLFANPISISHAFGAKGDRNTTAIGVAVFSLWLMNIGLNITQGPSWALVLDLTPSEQQPKSNSVISVLSSLASLFANVLAFINFSSFLHISNSTVLFYVGMIFTILFSLPTLIFAKEKHLTEKLKDELAKNPSKKKFFIHIWLISFFLTSATGSPFLFYFTDFMGQQVYGGDPNADINSPEYQLYDKGVRMGSLGNALLNVVGLCYSMVVPFLMDSRIGSKMTYMIGHMTAICLFLIPMVPQFRSVVLMVIVASFVGILNATSNILPYALMAQAVSKEDVGMYLGFLSIMQVLGQMFANFIAGLLMDSTKNLSVGIATGSIFGALGLISLGLLKLPKAKPKQEITIQPQEQNESVPLINEKL